MDNKKVETEKEITSIVVEIVIYVLQISFVIFLFTLFQKIIMAKGPEWVIFDYANFVTHEAGHFLFSLFSDEYLSIWGGTIVQLLIPFLLLIYFILQKSKLSYAFCVYWLGENLVNISHYVADARCQCLQITGSIHDWNYLLGKLNMLEQDVMLGRLIFAAGQLLMITAMLLMLYYIGKDIYKRFNKSDA